MIKKINEDVLFTPDSPRLIIDFGNTLAKVAVFNNRETIEVFSIEHVNIEQITALASKYHFYHCIISSVTAIPSEIRDFLEQNYHLTELDHNTPVPVKNLYKTPETLGKDRLAAVVGAFCIFPATNCLVIDAGTCITFDFLDNQGNYHGGAISPGVNLRFRALHTFTSRLPLINSKNFEGITGKTTEESILAGVLNGTVAEMKCTIHTYTEIYPDLQVVLTGGDMIFFETKLKSNIFATPNLVLAGLNEILNFNAVKKP